MARNKKTPTPTLAELLKAAPNFNQWQQQVLNEAIRLVEATGRQNDSEDSGGTTHGPAARDPSR